MTDDDEDKPDPFDHLPEGHPSRHRSYTVGKHRPPIGGRFPPGKSGNPKGKKKGKHVATQVREAFTALRTVSIGGRQYKLPTIVALVHQATAQAFRGDKTAIVLSFSLATRLGVLDEPAADGSEPPDEEERQIMEEMFKRMSRAYGRTDE